jgi:hypothetical protein
MPDRKRHLGVEKPPSRPLSLPQADLLRCRWTAKPRIPDYLIRVRSSPPQIPSQQPSILILDGPVSIRFPE